MEHNLYAYYCGGLSCCRSILNSWGVGRGDKQQLRTRGITADGLFKVQMGLAGVGTPDNTYAGMCGMHRPSKACESPQMHGSQAYLENAHSGLHML
jgi:hypothetical protein